MGWFCFATELLQPREASGHWERHGKDASQHMCREFKHVLFHFGVPPVRKRDNREKGRENPDHGRERVS